MRYFQINSAQNLQMVVKIRCYALIGVIMQMMTTYYHKLFWNNSHVACLFFVNNATMAHAYKWATTELQVEKVIH